MKFRIAGTFVDSLAMLSAQEQKASKTTAFDLQMAPANAGMRFHKLEKAKGLEFRAVVVMACDDEILPLQARIETVADDADLEDVYNTERHLLYVACTRARDRLLVTGVAPASEFLDDMRM